MSADNPGKDSPVTLIELKKVSKLYHSGGVTTSAADDVSMSVARGQFVAVVGHSGSGKTTLVSLIGGLTRPDSGQVLIDGVDIWSLSNPDLARLRSEQIGFCFQFSSLISTLNCLDNIRLPSAFAGAAEVAKAGGRRAMELLEIVGLPDKARAFPSELSGGQQRRVAIARALVNEPGIILADEPTGDLDEVTETDIMELFEGINRKGVTIVMVTHSRRLAARAGRILTMTNGSVSEAAAAQAAG